VCGKKKVENMSRRKILFVLNRMNVGGVEKSLLGLLNSLPMDRYEVHIGVVEADGGFLPFVPDNVKLFELPALHSNRSILFKRLGAFNETIYERKYYKAVKMLVLYACAQLLRTLIPFYKGFIKVDDSMPEYDVAVAYQGPSELIDYYVSHYVKAKRKIGWIHFDIDRFFVRPESVRRTYDAFEKIFVVSEGAKEAFDRRFPMFSDKTEVMYNIIDRDSNLRLAEELPDFPQTTGISIVTVGRICYLKAQDKAIEAAKILKERGFVFHWTFVGGGEEFDNIIRLTKSLGLNENVTFTGACPNPYPYVKNCGVYVQPSRSEGFCIAIGEAKLFGVPIVATDFVGAYEQLHDVPNSIIIPSPDPELIADAIVQASGMGRITPPDTGIPPQINRLVEIFG